MIRSWRQFQSQRALAQRSINGGSSSEVTRLCACVFVCCVFGVTNSRPVPRALRSILVAGNFRESRPRNTRKSAATPEPPQEHARVIRNHGVATIRERSVFSNFRTNTLASRITITITITTYIPTNVALRFVLGICCCCCAPPPPFCECRSAPRSLVFELECVFVWVACSVVHSADRFSRNQSPSDASSSHIGSLQSTSSSSTSTSIRVLLRFDWIQSESKSATHTQKNNNIAPAFA